MFTMHMIFKVAHADSTKTLFSKSNFPTLTPLPTPLALALPSSPLGLNLDTPLALSSSTHRRKSSPSSSRQANNQLYMRTWLFHILFYFFQILTASIMHRFGGCNIFRKIENIFNSRLFTIVLEINSLIFFVIIL